jgi:hypothetical protein
LRIQDQPKPQIVVCNTGFADAALHGTPDESMR